MNFPYVRTEGQAGRMKQRLVTIVAEGNTIAFISRRSMSR